MPPATPKRSFPQKYVFPLPSIEQNFYFVQLSMDFKMPLLRHLFIRFLSTSPCAFSVPQNETTIIGDLVVTYDCNYCVIVASRFHPSICTGDQRSALGTYFCNDLSSVLAWLPFTITMNDYRLESPPILRDFLSYHETIKAHSQKTVDEYFLDLRNFFRYLKQSRDPSLRDLPLSEISIMDVDLDFVKKVTLTDIYAYMTYLSRDRVQHQNSDVSDYGLNAASRARKIATIRSFYNYLTNKAHLLDTNPCKDLDSPKIKKSLPKYLTLDESVQLLQSVDGQNRERDYCILTIFLNCGLRISELCGLDLQDIQDDALRVLGKGNKVRIVYLNDACKDALKSYLAVRRPISGRDHNALFLSSRNERISRSSVHALVKKHLSAAGLDASEYSSHKLRHTAATLMLQNGVDVKAVQEVLGHEHLNTTEIYTHIDNDALRVAARANPLSHVKMKKDTE